MRSKRVELAAQAAQRAAGRGGEYGSGGPRRHLSQTEAAALMSAPGREPEVRARLIEELTWLQGLMNAKDAVGDGAGDGAGIERGGYLLGGDQPTVWSFLYYSLSLLNSSAPFAREYRKIFFVFVFFLFLDACIYYKNKQGDYRTAAHDPSDPDIRLLISARLHSSSGWWGPWVTARCHRRCRRC